MDAKTTAKSEDTAVHSKLSWAAKAALTPEDINRVLYDWQLTAVRLYEVRVERLEGRKPGHEPVTKPVLHSDVRVSVAGEGLLGRLTLNLVFPNEAAPEYRMRLSLDGLWRPRDSSVSLPSKDEVQDARLGATILTLLWPYARESAHDLMRRMEVPMHPLPTIDKLKIEALTQEPAQSGEPTDNATVE